MLNFDAQRFLNTQSGAVALAAAIHEAIGAALRPVWPTLPSEDRAYTKFLQRSCTPVDQQRQRFFMECSSLPRQTGADRGASVAG